MDYKSLMGFNKKKKTVKKESKPKVNKVIEGVKKQMNETFMGIQTAKDNPPFKTPQQQVKETSAGYDYHKITKKIEKSYKTYWDDVKNLQKILDKKGMKKEAQQLRKEYAKKVLGFHSWFRGMIDRLL